MAIVIEEEKKSSSLRIGNVLSWVFIVAVLAAAVYYLFFRRPELVPVTAPASLKNAEELSRVNVQPEEVLENERFKILKAWVPPPTTTGAGRGNPFLSP